LCQRTSSLPRCYVMKTNPSLIPQANKHEEVHGLMHQHRPLNSALCSPCQPFIASWMLPLPGTDAQQINSESNPLYGTKRSRNTRRSKTAHDADSFLSIHGKSHREPSSGYVPPGQSVADHKHLQPVHHHARGYEPVHGSRLSHPASTG